MEIKIDKKIPITEPTKRGRKRKYPFPDMIVGDSFFSEVTKHNLRMAGYLYSKNDQEGKWEFTTREEGSGTRIWRIE